MCGRHLLHHFAETKARRLLARRKFLETLEPFARDRLCRHDQEGALEHPLSVFETFRTTFEWITAKIEQVRRAKVGELALPHIKADMVLPHERGLPVAHTDGHQVAVIAPVKEAFARALLLVALEEGHEIVAVEMHLERARSHLVALANLV